MSFLHLSLFSTALCDLANSWPVHSLMLSSHLFLCLHCLLPHSIAPWKMVLARPDERETCLYHLILFEFASFYDSQQVFVWSDCLLDLGTNFFVGNIVLVRDAQYLVVAPHFCGWNTQAKSRTRTRGMGAGGIKTATNLH